MRRLILAFVILSAPLDIGAQTLPAPEEYLSCADQIVEQPACALDLALRQVPPEDRDRTTILRMIRIFRHGKLTFVSEPGSKRGAAARRIAEDWLIDRFSRLDVVDEQGLLREFYAELMPRLAESGMPRAIRALIPPTWALHPLNVCASESVLATAYAIGGEVEAARIALGNATSALAEARTRNSGAGRLVRDCPEEQFGRLAAYHLLAQGTLDAALSLLAAIVPQDRPQSMPMSMFLLPIPPDTIAGFIARTSDAGSAREARIVLVMSLAQTGRLDEAIVAAAEIADDPGRKLAIMQLARKLVDAGLEDRARDLANKDSLLGAKWVDKVIARAERAASAVAIQLPATLALDGRFAEAMRLAGDPDARWINMVKTSERLKAKSRLPQLLTIYVLAQAAHDE